MTKLPIISGRKAVKIFKKLGYEVIHQRGSHIKLRNWNTGNTLIIPDHKELDRGTLKGIIKDAEIEIETFLKLLK